MIYETAKVVAALDKKIELLNQSVKNSTTLAESKFKFTKEELENNLEDINKKTSLLSKAKQRRNWSEASNIAYKLYSAYNKMPKATGPNYTERDVTLGKINEIKIVRDMVASSSSDKVSSAELDKLGVLKMLKFVW